MKLCFEESLFVENTTKRWLLISPSNSYDCKTALPQNKNYKHIPTPLLQGGARKFCDGRDD